MSVAGMMIGRLSSRRRGFMRNNRALSSLITISGIMAIIIMVIGAILNTLVPQWAKEDESEHMEEVLRSFQNLRTNVNNLVHNSDIEITTTQLVKLGVSGNTPIGVIPSTGKLIMNPFENITRESITSETDALSIYGKGGGNLEYEAANYYFQDQTLVYEHGAVLLGQAGGAAMMAGPELEVAKYQLLNDTRSYGFFNPGTKDNPDNMEYRFNGRYGNLTLTYDIYDIDTLGEILVRLNGNVVALAPPTGNKAWSGPHTVDLRADMINDFTHNRIEFNHTSISGSDIEWGVRNVTLSANELGVSVTMITVIGNREDIAGRDSHTVHVKLLAEELNTYIWPTENLTLDFTTMYPEAWEDHLNAEMNESGRNLEWSADRGLTDYYITTREIETNYYVVSLVIKNVNRLDCRLANIQMSLS